jgi:hypothetical protein
VTTLAAQEHAEERLTKAAHALAKAEEQAEDDPDAAAEVAGAGSSTKPRMRL